MNPTMFLLIGVIVLLLYLLWKNKLKIITAIVIFALIFGGATFIDPSMISTVGNYLSEKGINIPNIPSINDIQNFVTNNPSENQKVEIKGLEQDKAQDSTKETEQTLNQEKDQQKSQEQPQTKSEEQKPSQQQIVQEPTQKQDPTKKKKIDNSLLEQLQRLLELYERLLKDKNSLESQLDDLRTQIDELRRLIEEQAQED